MWLQYLYFLRFCILAYLSLPILVVIDWRTGAAELTRGILTVDSGSQAFFAAFFVVALQMAVLVTARNVVHNGGDRFNMQPPPSLKTGLTSCSTRAVLWVLAFVHIPTYFALWYLGRTAINESEQFAILGEDPKKEYVWVFLGLGVLAALIFWYLVSLFYYWTYEPKGKRAAALIFPSGIFGDIEDAVHPPRLKRAESWTYSLLRVSCAGFAPSRRGPFWELHFFSAVALMGTILFYMFLYPFTAPIGNTILLVIGSLVTVVVAALFLYSIANAPTGSGVCKPKNSWAGPVKLTFQLLAMLAMIGFLAGAIMAGNFLEVAFPAIASILVLLIFGLWLLAGAGFFFDRYRAPVLTVVLLILLLPRILGCTYGERYYEARDATTYFKAPPEPYDLLKNRLGNRNDPLIIVTASGGGIHAAAWTAEVMAALEKSFHDAPNLNAKGYTFHDHLLLASGVSGGSVGLMPYMLEYASNGEHFLPPGAVDRNTADAFRARISNPPACSSLEAVAWGLEYYDLYRLLLDVVPPPIWYKQGETPDRTWALTTAFHRNLTDQHCFKKGTPPAPDAQRDFLTLDKAAGLAADGNMPAFTFNTTAEETGGRFLLSNYQVKGAYQAKATQTGQDFVPSESFLQAYAEENTGHTPADLDLATAARLSATFPYVSSATRLPSRYNPRAFHFLDGGYFDNDGTASVIEFLKSAFDPMLPHSPQPGATVTSAAPAQGNKASASLPPVRRILLIEIRDAIDLPFESVDNLTNQDVNGKPTWSAINQLTAPPVGLWNSGHISIARRNRRELCLLEDEYKQVLDLHHLVFTIQTDTSRSQPLNWKLTTHQRADIYEWLDKKTTRTNIASAVDWISTLLDHEDDKDDGINALRTAKLDICTTTSAPLSAK